ncbi:hypothetical protein E2562_021153 [Oryza meyeriana var. granulata]|uniref:Uncharacterized protein n=1 Tax=Oryza meyeriana var. granulata TaxID=110450 RepID=A0A6G1BMV2_9ORYZ|nr:hypothetical protein E2562_021153 [Oryza meyeriana var. granulata]
MKMSSFSDGLCTSSPSSSFGLLPVPTFALLLSFETLLFWSSGLLSASFLARRAFANKGGTAVVAATPKQAKSEGKGAMSSGSEKAVACYGEECEFSLDASYSQLLGTT